MVASACIQQNEALAKWPAQGKRKGVEDIAGQDETDRRVAVGKNRRIVGMVCALDEVSQDVTGEMERNERGEEKRVYVR